VGNLGPLSYPFPNLLLWTWAGIAGAEFFLAPRRRSETLDGDDVSRAVPAVRGDATPREVVWSAGATGRPKEKSDPEPIA